MLEFLRKAAARLTSQRASAASSEAATLDPCEFLATLFAAPSVTEVLSILEIDPDPIVQRLRTGVNAANADLPHLQAIVEGAQRRHQDLAQVIGEARPSLDLVILVSTCIQGPGWFRDLLSLSGRHAGDIPFYVAHGQREEDLVKLWPGAEQQTGRVMLVNDHYTPMEAVVAALETEFRIEREDAIRRMLDVHRLGAASLSLPDERNAGTACAALNESWRRAGLPLLCTPQRAAAAQ
jgi:ATP-dependent Clp protease adaptor protein ClpS